MTVSSTTTKDSYSGDNSNTVFAYTFKIFDEDDIAVILRDDATGTETTQTITTHYSVSGVGNAGGGNITFVTAPASGKTVVLLRTTPLTQLTDYTPNDPFPAEAHEDALDKLTFQVQEVQEELDRAIKVSKTNTITSTEFTVGASDRANKILGFDSNGDLSVTSEIGTYKGNWSASTTYQQRDIVKDTSTNNIFIANTVHTSSGSQPLTTNTDSAKWDLLVDASAATTAANTASDHRADAGKYAVTAHNTTFTLTATNGGTSGLYSALHYATESSNSASAASTSETNAATSETNAQDWAIKTNGIVDSVGYSAKAWSIGGTGVTNTAGSGAAQEWATKTTANVDGTEYSAKEYAVGTQTRGTTGSAKDWATYTAGTVDGSGYSAKYWAEQAAASADSFDDTYLGPKSSAPSVDNDGDPLTAGDLYFDTALNSMYVYTGSAWQQVAPSTAGFATNGFAIAMAIAL